MLWHLSLLHHQLYPQLNLLKLSDLLAPLPSRMVDLTPQSPQLQVVRPPSRLLPPQPPRLPLCHLPLHSPLLQRSIGRALQSSSKVPRSSLDQLLPLMQVPPPHVPPLYPPKPTRVHRILPSRPVLYARAKTAILLPHGPPFTRVPWQMAKTIASVSVGGRKLVLAAPVLAQRLRLCLARE